MINRVLINDVIVQACEVYEISRADLLGERRTRKIARPRQRAMYVAKKLTGRSYPYIGERFGGRDHTTVMHACQMTEERIQSDPEEAVAVQALLMRFAWATPAGPATSEELRAAA